MKDVSGVVKVVERIDSDVKETNIQIDRRTKELKQLESRFENLADRLAFLEQANIKKEGRIDYLEGVIQSMSDKLCRCGDREVSSVSVEAGTEEPMVEEAEGSQLEYAEDNEYHTPEVEEVPLPVRELRLIESPSVERLVNPFREDECCQPHHPGVGWRSAGPSPVSSRYFSRSFFDRFHNLVTHTLVQHLHFSLVILFSTLLSLLSTCYLTNDSHELS